ncbi:hypothetical protein, partial [Thiolapillus sp.]|uniref:hypothetical protein n=1 Tax=Thiolapillus sp. TaxID=2017437 RepID=UPI003AF655F3
MLYLHPGTRQIAIDLKGAVDLGDQIFIDHFGGQHLFQNFVAVKNGEFEIFRQLVHTKIIGSDYGLTHLTEGKTKTVSRRRRRTA